MTRAIVLSIAAYCLVSIIAFGDIFAPIAFMTFWSDRLAIPSWRALVLACAVIATLIFLFPKRIPVGLAYRLPVFVIISMALSIVIVGFFADSARKDAITKFQPDEYVDHSFYKSIREAPREFQFYLHAAALKNCVLYGWSYRTLSFYEIPPRAAKNVGSGLKSRCSSGQPPMSELGGGTLRD